MTVATEAEAAVPRLLPPQLPALLLQGARGGDLSAHPAGQQPTRLGAPPAGRRRAQQQQHEQQRAPRRAAAPARKAGTASTNGPRRIVPTAAGDAPRPGASSSRLAWTAPLNVAFRAIGAAGLGAGAGGLFAGPAAALQLRLWPFTARCGGGGAAARRGQRTILVMMSNTGGGHKASAEALKQALEERYGAKYKVVIVDMWKEHTPAPWNTLPDSYSFLVRHGALWRFTYTAIQPRAVHLPYFSALHAAIGAHLRAAFDAYDPDLVVSVHPLMQHIPTRVLAARAAAAGAARPPPFATVVTDFTTCHNTWFCRAVDKCFVPTEFCKQLGRRMGLSDEQLVLHGLPIRPVFSKRLPPKAALRKKLVRLPGGAARRRRWHRRALLRQPTPAAADARAAAAAARARQGLLPGVPAILLVGGGEGMGQLQATVEQLDARLRGSAQVAVICGRNKALLAKLLGHAWPGGSHVVACGFVDNIHEWMGASDLIITKAGPGTIAEALISGLPILLNGNVPCQEEGNIPYVADNGVGAFETRPDRIAAIVADWLRPDNAAAFAAMAARSAALGRPQAVYQIVADLARLADELGAAARRPAALPVAALGGA
ncbi:MGD A [Scenedesmus sp. PABB004]|nr:MGD A [Scenedesmus sp. PABB004]